MEDSKLYNELYNKTQNQIPTESKQQHLSPLEYLSYVSNLGGILQRINYFTFNEIQKHVSDIPHLTLLYAHFSYLWFNDVSSSVKWLMISEQLIRKFLEGSSHDPI